MHATFGERLGRDEDAPTWRVSFPEHRAEPIAASQAEADSQLEAGGYGAKRRPSITAIAIVVVAHALLLFALVKFDVIPVGKPKPKPLVVELLRVPPPPPAAAPPPKPEVALPKEVTPVVVAPAPLVQTLAPVPVIATAPKAPPPQAVVVGPPAAPAGPVGPVSVEDLSEKMISATPPKIPVESRRRKEQGTVFLSVLIGTDGSVQDISVWRSSGFARLDKAALDAVRRWRWSPQVRDGTAVMVRGIVDVHFAVQGRTNRT